MKCVNLLLINPPFHRRNGSGSIFPLGLGYILSAVQEKGFSCDVVDCSRVISSYRKDDLYRLSLFLKNELKGYNPNLVGIGPCITTQVRALRIISDCCKQQYGNEKIFAGGPLASIEDQEWFFFDFLGLNYIIKGDGEIAIVKLLEHMQRHGKIEDCKYVSHRNYNFFNEIKDINSISFPQRPFIDSNIISVRRSNTDEKKTVSMITSRGCLYHCKYCVSGNMNYKAFRKRNYKNIVDEMQFLKENYGITDIIFYDDCFFYNFQTVHRDIFDFCSMLTKRELNMTWQMEIRCDLFKNISDEDSILLYQSGCRQINLGIEKTSIERLVNLGKDTATLGGVAEKIKHLKSISKIKIAGTFILGGIGENKNNIEEMIEESTKMNLDFAHYNPLFIYPGTPLYQEYFKNKEDWVEYILEDEEPWGEVVYENEHVNKEQLLKLVENAYEKFYSNSIYKDTVMVKDRFNLNRGRNNEDI